MAKTAILTLKILADARDAAKGLDDTATGVDKLQAGVGRAAVPAAAALAALGAAGLSAANAAAEDQRAADLLAVSLRNSTGATDAQIAANEKWITKTSKAAAVADDELRPALATLVRATGDVSTSQDAMGVALDVSAATGKDVESVSNALAKAYAGNTASLGKLVPGMDKAVLATGDMNLIMAELARTTGGAAAAAADSAAGRMENMKIQMGEAQEAIGSLLLPALSAVAGMLSGFAGFVQENTTLIAVLAGVIAAFAAGILVLNAALKIYQATQKAIAVATKAWAAVQWLLNAAMSANPIGLVIIAVVALVAVFVLLWQRSEAFRNFFIGIWDGIQAAATAVWSAIQTAAQAVWDFLTSMWDGIRAAAEAVWNAILTVVGVVFNILTVYVQTYLAIVTAVWNGIMAAAQFVWNAIKIAIKVVIDWITDRIQAVRDTVNAVWNAIKSTAEGVWEDVKSAATTALNAIKGPIDAVKSAFDAVVSAIRSVIDWLGRIKIPDVLGNIGNLIGGLFSAPAPARAASRTAGTVFTGGPARFGLGAAPSLAGGIGGNGGVTIVVQGALDPTAVARQIRQILSADDRRRGGVRIA